MRLGVPEYNLTVRKKNIFNQNVPDSCGAATTVQQEIDNNPLQLAAGFFSSHSSSSSV